MNKAKVKTSYLIETVARPPRWIYNAAGYNATSPAWEFSDDINQAGLRGIIKLPSYEYAEKWLKRITKKKPLSEQVKITEHEFKKS